MHVIPGAINGHEFILYDLVLFQLAFINFAKIRLIDVCGAFIS